VPLGRPGRLTVAVVALALCALALFATLTTRQAGVAMRAQGRDRVRDTAVANATFIHQRIGDVESVVAGYAARPQLAGALGDGGASRDTTTLQGYLALLSQASPGIATAFITDAHGALVAVNPPSPSLLGRDFSYRDWYRGVAAQQRPYVSAAFHSAATARLRVIAIAVPVRAVAAPHRVLAYLITNYSVASLQHDAEAFARSDDVHLRVTDQHGVVLAEPGADPSALLDESSDHRVTEALAGRSGVVEWQGRGGDLISAYAPIGDLGWTVTADVPTGVALRGITRVRSTVLATAGVLALVLLGVTGMLALASRRSLRAEAVVQRHEVRTRGILDAASEAFVAVGPDGRIAEWNPAAERVFGRARDDVLGVDLADCVCLEEDREAMRHAVSAMLAGTADDLLGRTVEVRNVHRDGRRFPAEVRAWAHDLDGVRHLHAFVADISDRKAAETALRAALEHEQQLVSRLRELDRVKSDFVSNVSHELRTPLTSIAGYTEMLADGDAGQLSADQRRMLDIVERNTRRLLALIEDLLALSRIESGAFKANLAPTDLSSLLHAVAQVVHSAASAQQLELVVEVPTDLPPVLADPGQLDRAIINVVSNAVKFTPPGGRVTISGRVSGGRVAIEVADTGLGIEPADLQRLFTRFFRSAAATEQEIPGTGLGLVIVKNIVDHHGGEIEVTSTPGAGTTVTITLPVVEDLVADLAPRLSGDEAGPRR